MIKKIQNFILMRFRNIISLNSLYDLAREHDFNNFESHLAEMYFKKRQPTLLE